jgi:hypothetical protein
MKLCNAFVVTPALTLPARRSASSLVMPGRCMFVPVKVSAYQRTAWRWCCWPLLQVVVLAVEALARAAHPLVDGAGHAVLPVWLGSG